jgi:hypothetical protein
MPEAIKDLRGIMDRVYRIAGPGCRVRTRIGQGAAWPR